MSVLADEIRSDIDSFAAFLPKIKNIDNSTFESELTRRLEIINQKSLEIIKERPGLLQYAFQAWAEELDKGSKHRRARNKPEGYAGDYLITDWIYNQNTQGDEEAKRWDEFFYLLSAAQAMRNRKDYFCKVINELYSAGKRRIKVLNIGSGPCRDIHDALIMAGPSSNGSYFHCVDKDKNAVEYASNLVGEHKGEIFFEWSVTNVYRLKTRNKYHLVWSAGLFDYLCDHAAIALMKRMWDWTEIGGKMIVGNFCPNNPSRNYMEWALAWFLIHRTEKDLLDLCVKAGIPPRVVKFCYEPSGVNLFCVAYKI